MRYKIFNIYKVIMIMLVCCIAQGSEVILSCTKDERYVTVNIRDNGSVLYRHGKELEDREMEWEILQVEPEKANLIINYTERLIKNHEMELHELVLYENRICVSLKNGRSSAWFDADAPGLDVSGLIKMIESLSATILVVKTVQ